jgi:hypothetical protein
VCDRCDGTKESAREINICPPLSFVCLPSYISLIFIFNYFFSFDIYLL